MRTLLVDDHALFLEGLQGFLGANGIEVIGTARNGSEALLKYEMLKPDLILMDIQMADCDGIEATRMIKKAYPEARIVMLTAVEDDDSLFAAVAAGAAGYLLKEMEPESFMRQLSGLAAGETPLAPGLAARLLREFSHAKQQKEEGLDREPEELTGRQTELLQLLAEGQTYKEIAYHLGITVATVRYHIKEILAKTRLSNRAQLIAHASRQGLGRKN